MAAVIALVGVVLVSLLITRVAKSGGTGRFALWCRRLEDEEQGLPLDPDLEAHDTD